MNRFQSTFLPLLETEENSHLPSLSLSYLLQVHFCFCIHVATCPASPNPISCRVVRKTTEMNLQEKRERKEGRHVLRQEELSMQKMVSPWWQSQDPQDILRPRI